MQERASPTAGTQEVRVAILGMLEDVCSTVSWLNGKLAHGTFLVHSFFYFPQVILDNGPLSFGSKYSKTIFFL